MSYRDDSMTGQALTTREAEVLAMHDAGKTAKDIADAFGYASANGAGNVVRVALTKAGRGGEIGTRTGGGGGKRKMLSAEDQIQASLDAAEATIGTLRERLTDAETAVSLKPGEILKAEKDRLTTAVQRATDALAEFDAMDADAKKAMVDKHRHDAETRLDALKSTLAEDITKAESERDKMRVALDAIQALSA